MKRLTVAILLVGALGLVGLAYEGSIVFQAPHGAKALGMGGAFTALADDGTTMIWNPAALALKGEGLWLGGATSNLFGMVGYQFVSAGGTFAGYAVAAGWANATAGELYSANAFMGAVGFALGDFGSLGVNLKYYMEKVGTADNSGFGFDVGLLVPITPEIKVALSAKDVATTIAGQTVTPVYTIGAGFGLLEGALQLAVDLSLTGAFAPKDLRAGLEFMLIENLAVRAGVVVPGLDFANYYFTVGAGFKLAGLSVDAAYVFLKEPGESLVLSATFLFGELFAPEEGPTP